MGTIATIKTYHVAANGIRRKPTLKTLEKAHALATDRGVAIANDGRACAPFVRIPKGMRIENGKLVSR